MGRFAEHLWIYEIFRMVIGVASLLIAAIAFSNLSENLWMLSLLFVAGAVQCVLIGIINIMTRQKNSGIGMIVLGFLLLVFGILSFITVL